MRFWEQIERPIKLRKKYCALHVDFSFCQGAIERRTCHIIVLFIPYYRYVKMSWEDIFLSYFSVVLKLQLLNSKIFNIFYISWNKKCYNMVDKIKIFSQFQLKNECECHYIVNFFPFSFLNSIQTSLFQLNVVQENWNSLISYLNKLMPRPFKIFYMKIC